MSDSRKIRVLVIDDSAFMRTAIRRMLESAGDIEVIDTAKDGTEGVEKIASLRPDVVTLDFEMPRMSGLELLRQVMPVTPLPIIVVSSLTQEGAEATLEALEAGAFDYVSKQLSYASLDIVNIQQELVAKVRAASQSPRLKMKQAAPARTFSYESLQTCQTPRLICIGTSTGGPKALQELLPALPEDLPVPVAIVQHMPKGFTGPFSRRLNSISRIRVSEAEHNETLEPGHVYIAPAGSQLTFVHHGLSKIGVNLSPTPSDTPHIPSVDVMMLSAAELLRDRAMGVIMTGMGNDGERGMRAIFRSGGYTLGQDEQSCVVWGMPRSCQESSLLRRVAPLNCLAHEIALAAMPRPSQRSSPTPLSAAR
jgi:two-component system, chemotaxis family, protein-glutamate methylesterase/glutaminase